MPETTPAIVRRAFDFSFAGELSPAPSKITTGLYAYLRRCRCCWHHAQVVTELSKLLGQVFGAMDEQLWFMSRALLDVTHSFMEDLPDEPAEPCATAQTADR